jgi:hypothetical protein
LDWLEKSYQDQESACWYLKVDPDLRQRAERAALPGYFEKDWIRIALQLPSLRWKDYFVAHVLEGSVQKSGDAVRVNVQLIKAANDSHLWADTFDRKLTDIFSVESEVAKAIAERLRGCKSF